MRAWARLPLILLICGLAAVVHGGEPSARWLAVSATSPAAAEVGVETSGESTRVTLRPAGLELQPVRIEGRDYLRLRAPGSDIPLGAGRPELPYHTLRLRIPDRGKPAARVLAQKWREIPGVPVPAKGNLSREVDPGEAPWVFGAAYEARGAGPVPAEAVRLGEPFLLRDLRGAALQVQLVRWDPARDVLLVLESIELEIFTTPDKSVNERLRPAARRDAVYEHLYRAGFANYDAAGKYERIATRGRMLVVCPEAFVQSVQDFVHWKRQRGIPTEVVTVEQAGGTVQGIRAFVEQLYAEPEGLTYLVLVGDLEQVPTWRGDFEGAHDDTRYGRVAGDDFYPDLLVSRISARNDTEVRTQTGKFIAYERDPEPGGRWYARAAGIASNQGVPTDAVRAGWLRDDLLAYGFTEVDEIYAPTGSTADIVAALDEGRSLVNYLGHGSGASWSSPYFHSSDIATLANGPRLPWILDVSCNNGDFERAECFAEAWLRAGSPGEPRGAIGMYSASTTTPWVPPTVMQAEAVDLLTTGVDRTLGALCTHGIMEVLDTYPGPEGLQLVEQYNLFGDCSLEVRAAAPRSIEADHPLCVSVGGPAFRIETGQADLTAALSSGGELYAAGRTDPTGTVELEIARPPAGGAQLTLTITGRDCIPYVTQVTAGTADGVSVQPGTIPVGAASEVQVQWFDPEAGKALPGRIVTIEGFGLPAVEAVTDSSGWARLTVQPRFGETLRVSGREPGTDFVRFVAELPVTGADPIAGGWLGADVPSVGLVDTLATNLEARVRGVADEPGLELFLRYYDIERAFAAAGTTATGFLTPTWTGTVEATLAQEGRQILQRGFEVIRPVRDVAGTVLADADEAPLHRVRVYGFAAGDDPAGIPVFDVETDLAGRWSAPVEIPIGNYDLHLEKLGYLARTVTVAILPGGGDLEHRLEAAPHGLVSGTVTAREDGSGLFTLVEAYRADTGEKVAHVWSTGDGGTYRLPALPYFDYDILVAPPGYTPQRKRLTVDRAALPLDFALDATEGNLLVLDAGQATAQAGSDPVPRPARLNKTGTPLSEAYTAPLSRSALEILSEATQLGYDIGYATGAAYDASLWPQYDLVIVACGDESGALTEALKSDLRAHVAAGGKLLIEGGDVARDEITDGGFARDVLHVSRWVADEPGDLAVFDALHPVMGYPHPLPPSLELEAAGAGSADAVVPTADAVIAGSWTNSWADGGVICFGPESLLGAGQSVFFAFDYAALETDTRRELLHNAVHWLVEPDAGRASIAGTVSVLHAVDASNVTLRLDPGGRLFVTGPDGAYSFDGLYAGNYTLTATRPGWSSASAAIALTQEQQVTGLDFELSDVQTVELYDAPEVAIPDDDPDGVSCTMEVALDARLSAVEVYVDLTHPYLADLVIDLVGPTGTAVRLHQHNGADGDDLLGWYPSELTSYGILDALVGERCVGTWTLRLVDGGPWDSGVLHEWGLRLTYAAVSGVQEEAPLRTVLLGNRPNPFNPATVIEFELAAPGPVRLEVFDVAGRRLARLLDEPLGAGRHAVRWDGRDARGRAAASGTYFYRLTGPAGQHVRKMLLVR